MGCGARHQITKPRWRAEWRLGVTPTPPGLLGYDGTRDTILEIEVFYGGWKFIFVHGGKSTRMQSWNGKRQVIEDGWKMAAKIPALADIGKFVAQLEEKHDIGFRRDQASIRVSLAGGKNAVRDWLLAK